jgi:hypothetical protein
MGLSGGIGNSIKGISSNFTGGMIGGSGQNANTRAYQAQAGAADRANAVLGNAYTEQKGYLNPYLDVGKQALGNLTNPNFMPQDPSYNFRMQEGQKAINAGLASRGLGSSGSALRALTKYGQDLASQEYGNAFNRNLQLAGMGQQSATNLAGMGGQYGSNVSGNITGLGNAAAARDMGIANQQSAFINRLYENAGTGMRMFGGG